MNKLVVICIKRILPLAYMALIWFLSGRPSDHVIYLGIYDAIIKESLHLIEFAILYAFWVLAFTTWGNFTEKDSNWAAVLSSAYSAIDEAHQYFVPLRSATFIDLFKDLLGVALAWYIVRRHYFKNDRAVK